MGVAIIWIFTQWQHLSQEIPGNGCLNNAPTPVTHQHQQILNLLSPPTNTQSTTTTTTTTTTYNNTHTTTTQQKNKIKHLFETTNLGFLNFNRWFQRSWLLLDLISARLMLLDVISMRLAANDGLRYYSTLSAIGERFQWAWVRMTGVVWSKFLVFG